MTGGMHIDKLKQVVADSLPEKVLRDTDGGHCTKPPWQQRTQNTKKPFEQTQHPTHFASGVEDGDAYAVKRRRI